MIQLFDIRNWFALAMIKEALVCRKRPLSSGGPQIVMQKQRPRVKAGVADPASRQVWQVPRHDRCGTIKICPGSMVYAKRRPCSPFASNGKVLIRAEYSPAGRTTTNNHKCDFFLQKMLS